MATFFDYQGNAGATCALRRCIYCNFYPPVIEIAANNGFISDKGIVMSNIAIVGVGQSGLKLALSLLAAGYRVTLMTNRDVLSLHRGRVMSSQCIFIRR